MPFDGTAPDLIYAIAFLERGLARVTAGYCCSTFYRPPRWFRAAPKFCMVGALNCRDHGEWDLSGEDCYGRRLAEKFLQQAIGGEPLLYFGSRPWARRGVIRAYKHALEAARAESKEK